MQAGGDITPADVPNDNNLFSIQTLMHFGHGGW